MSFEKPGQAHQIVRALVWLLYIYIYTRVYVYIYIYYKVIAQHDWFGARELQCFAMKVNRKKQQFEFQLISMLTCRH